MNVQMRVHMFTIKSDGIEISISIFKKIPRCSGILLQFFRRYLQVRKFVINYYYDSYLKTVTLQHT